MQKADLRNKFVYLRHRHSPMVISSSFCCCCCLFVLFCLFLMITFSCTWCLSFLLKTLLKKSAIQRDSLDSDLLLIARQHSEVKGAIVCRGGPSVLGLASSRQRSHTVISATASHSNPFEESVNLKHNTVDKIARQPS